MTVGGRTGRHATFILEVGLEKLASKKWHGSGSRPALQKSLSHGSRPDRRTMRVEANGVPTRGAMTTTQEPSAAAAEGCRLRTGSRSTASDPERAESVSQMARQAPPTLRSSTERSEGWVSRESNSAAPTDLSAGQSSRMTQTNVEPLEARYALTLTNRNSTRVTSASGLAAEGKSHTKYDGKDVTFDIQAEVATVSRVGPRLRRQNAVKVDVKRESEKLTSGSVRSAVNVKARKARAGGPLPAPVDGKAAAGGPYPRLGVPGAAEARSDENLDVEREPEKPTSGSDMSKSAANVKARKACAGGPLPAPVDGKAAAGGPCPRLGVPGAAEARSGAEDGRNYDVHATMIAAAARGRAARQAVKANRKLLHVTRLQGLQEKVRLQEAKEGAKVASMLRDISVKVHTYHRRMQHFCALL